MTRTNIEFDANGTTLRGWLYQPDKGKAPYPTVVAAHGFSVLKEMGLNDYAEIFAAAGLAVIVYDNRNLGASDGEPRFEIDWHAQMRDYSHAITFAQTLDIVAPNRIGVWGTSYTGGLALIVAALDHRVKCVVSQIPYLHGMETLKKTTPPEKIEELYTLIEKERRSIAIGNAPRTMPVYHNDLSSPRESASRLTADFFDHYLSKGIKWENKFTIRSILFRLEYNALAFVDLISPKPLLMIVAKEDTITPTEICLRAYEKALDPKELLLIEGHHYRPYLDAFDESSGGARDWFLKHL